MLSWASCLQTKRALQKKTKVQSPQGAAAAARAGKAQRKRQRQVRHAKAPTQQEFHDVMAYFVEEAEKKVRRWQLQQQQGAAGPPADQRPAHGAACCTTSRPAVVAYGWCADLPDVG